MDPCNKMCLIMIIFGLLGLKIKSKLYEDDLVITVLAQISIICGLAGFILTIISSILWR